MNYIEGFVNLEFQWLCGQEMHNIRPHREMDVDPHFFCVLVVLL
jgi:hypothetical protein